MARSLSPLSPEQGRRLFSAFLPLGTSMKQPIQSGGFHSSDSSTLRSHTASANFCASSAAPFPGLFHPGSTYGLFSTGVSPPTTVRVLSHASSPHAVTVKVATLSASAPPRLQRDSQSVQLQGFCPSPESVLVAQRRLTVGPVVPLLSLSFLGSCPQRSIGAPFRPPPLMPFSQRTPRGSSPNRRLQSLFATP